MTAYDATEQAYKNGYAQGRKDALGNEALYGLADMVNQFSYRTKFHGKDALCDGGLSALENAFWMLGMAGCKINSNGTIQVKNLHQFMEKMKENADD